MRVLNKKIEMQVKLVSMLCLPNMFSTNVMNEQQWKAIDSLIFSWKILFKNP